MEKATELNRGLAPARSSGLLLCAFSAVRSVAAVGLAYATRSVMNGAIYGGNWLAWGCVLLALAAAVPALSWISTTYALRVTDRTVCTLRTSLLQTLRHKDCQQVNALHSGTVLNRLLNDCRVLTERYTHILPELAGQLVQLIGAAAVLTMLHIGLAVCVLAFGAAAAAVGYGVRKRLRPLHAEVRGAEERLTAALTEELEQDELLRCGTDNSAVQARVERRQEKWYTARRGLFRLSLRFSTLFSLALQLGSAALILWGAYRTGKGMLPFGDFTAMLQLVALFRAPISALTGAQSRLAASDAARERMEALYCLPEETELPFPAGEVVPRKMVFESVTFTYEAEEAPVFENFSAEIDLQRWTCLTGVSGRGKSTLYRLMLGLYHPQSGRIYLKTDQGEFPVSAASRGLFALVPQTPVLFSGTIRENLLLFSPDASEEDAASALAQAKCDFVAALPEGLDTVLGQFGEGLSVGQRQRLAIARILLTPGRILLLDEITSALDGENAAAVVDALYARCPAAVFSTHHPELLEARGADTLCLEDCNGRK